MKSAERVLAALRLEEPDRVPVIEFVIDPGVRRKILPRSTDFGDLADYLDLDCVGCGAVFSQVSGDDTEWTDEWGVRYRASEQVVPHPVHGPIETMDDVRTYEPPDPNAPGRLGKLHDFAERYKGERAVGFHHRAAFMWSCYLMGIDRMLMALVTEPDLAGAVLDLVVDVNEKICRNAVRAGADFIVLGDDYATNAGPFFSPATFEELLLPRLKRVVDAIHEEGGFVIKHSDGNVWPLLDMIIETGADGLNPIEPTAGMDLAEVKEHCGDRICLTGNVDCGKLLSEGSEAEVEETVRRCIQEGAPGGGYMLSSSNSVHASVKPENYVAMVRAGKRYGKYPLRL